MEETSWFEKHDSNKHIVLLGFKRVHWYPFWSWEYSKRTHLMVVAKNPETYHEQSVQNQ